MKIVRYCLYILIYKCINICDYTIKYLKFSLIDKNKNLKERNSNIHNSELYNYYNKINKIIYLSSIN